MSRAATRAACLWLMDDISTCVISIVRLSTLEAAATSFDSTWDNTQAALWSYLELTIAIVAACLPTLRPFMARFFPRLIQSSSPAKGGGGSSKDGPPTWGSVGRDRNLPRRYGRVSESTEAFSSDPELGMRPLPAAPGRGRGDLDGFKVAVAQRGRNEKVICPGAAPPQPRSRSRSVEGQRRGCRMASGIRATTVIRQEYEGDGARPVKQEVLAW